MKRKEFTVVSSFLYTYECVKKKKTHDHPVELRRGVEWILLFPEFSFHTQQGRRRLHFWDVSGDRHLQITPYILPKTTSGKSPCRWSAEFCPPKHLKKSVASRGTDASERQVSFIQVGLYKMDLSS